MLFGASITLVMVAVIARHRANQRVFDSEALIGEPAPARIAQPAHASTLTDDVDDEPVAQHGKP